MNGETFSGPEYTIRPNKTVVRKLLFEGISAVGRRMSLREHQYIGFGSHWFLDFLMAHNLLGIRSMVSIESEHPKRANFNRPLASIEVEAGLSSDVLPNLDYTSPMIIWLDYTDLFDSIALQDIEVLAGSIAAPSIIMLTTNIDHRTLSSRSKQYREDGNGTTIDYLSKELGLAPFIPGDITPTALKKAKSAATFHSMMIDSAMNLKFHEAGRGILPSPFFAATYADGARMLTVGYLCTKGPHHLDTDEIRLESSEAVFPSECADVDVPRLTKREKVVVDRHLDMHSTTVNGHDVRRELNFEVPDPHLENYRRFFRHYPVFAEILT